MPDTCKYSDIKVDDNFIQLHRSGRKELREGSKLIPKSDPEKVELDKLFKVYRDFPKLNKVEVNKYLEPGRHYAPAQFILKEAGLYDNKGHRIAFD